MVPLAGRDYNTSELSQNTLMNYYMPPYLAAKEAGVATFMASFNEINGVPSTGNKWLMTDLLRKDWGFNGFVVTDYTGINEMVAHSIVRNDKEAGELADERRYRYGYDRWHLQPISCTIRERG